MNFALALAVPEEIGRALQPVRERYAHGALLPPHLTILYPFVMLGAERHVIETLTRLLAETPPITMRLGEVRAFEPSHTIYIEVHDDGATARLYERLIAALSGLVASDRREYRLFAEHGYIPHLTLTDEVSTATYKRAWSALAGRSFGRDPFTVTTAVLYRTDGHDWRETARFELAGTIPSPHGGEGVG